MGRMAPGSRPTITKYYRTRKHKQPATSNQNTPIHFRHTTISLRARRESTTQHLGIDRTTPASTHHTRDTKKHVGLATIDKNNVTYGGWVDKLPCEPSVDLHIFHILQGRRARGNRQRPGSRRIRVTTALHETQVVTNAKSTFRATPTPLSRRVTSHLGHSPRFRSRTPFIILAFQRPTHEQLE